MARASLALAAAAPASRSPHRGVQATPVDIHAGEAGLTEQGIMFKPTIAALAGLAFAVGSMTATAATVQTFTNNTPITINDGTGTATPIGTPASVYPSSIAVSGFNGAVGDVKVTLHGFSHTYLSDVELVLVSPSGQKVSLMNAAGGSYDFSSADVTFSADAAGFIPNPTTNPSVNPIPSGTFLPTSGPDIGSMPAPAPLGPYSLQLSSFNGSAANGQWQLYVADFYSIDSGSIAGGWSITLTSSFSTCRAEGYSGSKLGLCQQICEKNYSGAKLSALIKVWMALYRQAPACSVI